MITRSHAGRANLMLGVSLHSPPPHKLVTLFGELDYIAEHPPGIWQHNLHTNRQRLVSLLGINTNQENYDFSVPSF